MNAMNSQLKGLIAAPHSPFGSDGTLDTSVIPKQADLFQQTGVSGCFIGGTTGESLSLSHTERIDLIKKWAKVRGDYNLKLVAHVGGNSLIESVELARIAQESGVDAIAAFAPSFFRPSTIEELIEYCAPIANAACDTPFYYYHIPSMTNVHLSMTGFLDQAGESIPTLAGLKFTHSDLCEEMECLLLHSKKHTILHGFDETLLAGLSIGVRGAVGSTYNYAAPLYLRLMDAFEAGDLENARQWQARSAQMIRLIQRYGFMAASKAIMSFFDVDCGPVRRPLVPLTNQQLAQLRDDLQAIGFFEWVQPE